MKVPCTECSQLCRRKVVKRGTENIGRIYYKCETCNHKVGWEDELEKGVLPWKRKPDLVAAGTDAKQTDDPPPAVPVAAITAGPSATDAQRKTASARRPEAGQQLPAAAVGGNRRTAVDATPVAAGTRAAAVAAAQAQAAAQAAVAAQVASAKGVHPAAAAAAAADHAINTQGMFAARNVQALGAGHAGAGAAGAGVKPPQPVVDFVNYIPGVNATPTERGLYHQLRQLRTERAQLEAQLSQVQARNAVLEQALEAQHLKVKPLERQLVELRGREGNYVSQIKGLKEQVAIYIARDRAQQEATARKAAADQAARAQAETAAREQATSVRALKTFLEQAGAAAATRTCSEKGELLALARERLNAWEIRRVIACSKLQGYERHVFRLTRELHTLAALQKSWRDLRIRLHPDKNPGDDLATPAFQFLQVAFEKLKKDFEGPRRACIFGERQAATPNVGR
eukprot:XP_001703123.1 predicted protein [Chlamydomonas reinhardtii]